MVWGLCPFTATVHISLQSSPVSRFCSPWTDGRFGTWIYSSVFFTAPHDQVLHVLVSLSSSFQAVLFLSSHRLMTACRLMTSTSIFTTCFFLSGMISQALRQLLCMGVVQIKWGICSVFPGLVMLPPSIRPIKHVTHFRPLTCFYSVASSLLTSVSAFGLSPVR